MLYSSNKPAKNKSMLINSKRYENFAVRDYFKEQVCVIESNLLALSHRVRKAHKETFNLLMYGFFSCNPPQSEQDYQWLSHWDQSLFMAELLEHREILHKKASVITKTVKKAFLNKRKGLSPLRGDKESMIDGMSLDVFPLVSQNVNFFTVPN